MRRILYLILFILILFPHGKMVSSYQFGSELKYGDYIEYEGHAVIDMKYNVTMRLTFLVKSINDTFIQFETRINMNGKVINTGQDYDNSFTKQILYERDTQILYYNDTVLGMFSLFRNTSWTGENFLMGWTNSTRVYGRIRSQDNALFGKFGFQNSYALSIYLNDYQLWWAYYDNDTGYLLEIFGDIDDPILLNLIGVGDLLGDLQISDASISLGPPYIPKTTIAPEGFLLIGGVIFGSSYILIKKSRAGRKRTKPTKPKRIKS